MFFHWYTYDHTGGELNINQTAEAGNFDGPLHRDSGSGERIDLNTAGIDDLDSLDYIDTDTARIIVEHREKYGEFKSLEDIYYIEGLTARIRKVLFDSTYI